MPRVWARLTTPEGYKNGVGERVQERRLALGLTQTALGGRIAFFSEGGWSPTEDEVFGLEKRERLVSDLELRVLATSLECSILYLMGLDNTLPPPPSASDPSLPRPRRRDRQLTASALKTRNIIPTDVIPPPSKVGDSVVPDAIGGGREVSSPPLTGITPPFPEPHG